MGECKWCVDEICVNADCPMRADYCPVPNDPNVCKWEDRESICRKCFHSYVCEQFNEHKDDKNKKCHFFNDHFVPTADVVEVKHGYWYLLDECANEGVYCSVCNKKVYGKHYANVKKKSKFCPNCGAKMDKRRENNAE